MFIADICVFRGVNQLFSYVVPDRLTCAVGMGVQVPFGRFPVNGVIAGWTEALQLMTVGSKWKLFIPYQLAYGERGAGGAIGPYQALVFEIELLAIL